MRPSPTCGLQIESCLAFHTKATDLARMRWSAARIGDASQAKTPAQMERRTCRPSPTAAPRLAAARIASLARVCRLPLKGRVLSRSKSRPKRPMLPPGATGHRKPAASAGGEFSRCDLVFDPDSGFRRGCGHGAAPLVTVGCSGYSSAPALPVLTPNARRQAGPPHQRFRP